MAHENKVIHSLEDPSGVNCVDVFVRPDGSYGFVTCRRDPEDGRGWAITGASSGRRFHSADAALKAAKQDVAWLE